MTDLLPMLVSADLRADLARDKITANLDGFVVQTAEQATIVADIQREAHRRLKDLDEKRLTVTRPLDQAKKAVDALFKPITDPLKKLKGHCGDLLTAWEQHKRALEIEARGAAAALSAVGQVQAATAVVAASKPAPQDDYGVSWVWVVKSWDVDKVPRDWLRFDETYAGDYCDRYKTSEVIPEVLGIVFERVAKQRVKS
jgi:hypothetical protein